MRILVFGDSIVYGAWDSQGGWADRLKQHFHKEFIESNGAKKIQLINLGIGGDSSIKILKRLPFEIESHYSKSWPYVFVFSFCTNDERSLNGINETSLDQFKTNAQDIINKARKYTEKILFCGVPPLGQPVLEFKGLEYSDQRIIEYETVLKQVLSFEHIPFVDIRSASNSQENQNLFSIDNLHPNDAGHKLIADLVLPELEKLLA